MIRSMTAFARGEHDTRWGRLSCEIRSVNHRYLDVSVRLPEVLRSSEPVLRERIRARCERGKVECGLRLDRAGGGGPALELDPAVLAQVFDALAKVTAELGDAAGRTDPLDVLRWPGVIREPDSDPDTVGAVVTALVDEVLTAFVAHRELEGGQLRQLIEQRLEAVEAITADVRQHATGLVEGLRNRLRERAQSLANDLDPGRLEQEVAMLAQKADVAEELDRLGAHVAAMRQALAAGGAVGRRLDFLAQELNREANTLASKASGADVATRAVDLKVLIEQIREQIQNLE